MVLGRAGRRVLLLDPSTPGAFRVGEALPPSARPLLRDLGLLDRFLDEGHLPCYGNLSAWGAPWLHPTDFLFDRNGHGWHLDRARFDAQVRDAARAAGAKVRTGARLTSAERLGKRWRIEWSGEGRACEVRSSWVVDATGRRCAVARRHGATRLHDDGLVAFFARFHPAVPGADRDARTLIEAVPDGWWYTALVPSGERVVAFLTDPDLVDRSALLSSAGFVAALAGTNQVGAALTTHGYAIAGRPRGTDAGSARLDRFAGPGWLAAGDAALSFDPLSSQGILNALYTGMKAGQALDAHLSGDMSALAGYASRLEEIHQAYQRNRTTYYGYETRWPGDPFWRRRRGGSVPPELSLRNQSSVAGDVAPHLRGEK